MTVNAWNTGKLIEKIEQRKAPIPYFMARMFGEIANFETEEIHFDYVLGERRMAPFVSPVVQGRVMRSKGSTMKSFTPAYVKPKHAVRPTEVLKRRPGESFGGSLSPAQRFELAKIEKLREQDEMIDNRIEWMCIEVMKHGQITVKGEDYPEKVVSYGRDTSLTITKAGAELWSDNSSNPMEHLEDASTAASNADHGAPIREWYMNANTWKVFRKHPNVKDLLDKNFRGSDVDINRGPVTFSKEDAPLPVGSAGNFLFFVDSRDYEDEEGNMQPYFADGEVMGCSTAIGGVQAFGAILDADYMEGNGVAAVRAFPKVWKNKDPSAWFAMTQSAPLPIAKRINGTTLLNVL